jgi:hypothetical protein
MGVSVVDGVLEAAEGARRRGANTIYKQLRFRADGGGSRTLKNAVVRNTIADRLTTGAHARYYLFTALDIRGVHGLRTDDGAALCDFPGTNAKIFAAVGLINLALLIGFLAIEGGVRLLPLGLVILGAVGYYFTAKAGREARAQFAADEDYRRVPIASPPAIA